MKFFLFWLGMGLAAIAQAAILAALGDAMQGGRSAIGWVLLALPFMVASWFVIYSWALTHRVKVGTSRQ